VFVVTDCPVRQTLHLIFELHDTGYNGSSSPTPIAWGKLFLFDLRNQLAGGRWRIKLHKPPVRLNASSTTTRDLPRVGYSELCVRLVDGSLLPHHGSQPVNCQPRRYGSVMNGRLGCASFNFLFH
jgi:hypothetical protein